MKTLRAVRPATKELCNCLENTKYLLVINTELKINTGDTCLQAALCEMEIRRCVAEQAVHCPSWRPGYRSFLDTSQKFKSRADI